MIGRGEMISMVLVLGRSLRLCSCVSLYLLWLSSWWCVGNGGFMLLVCFVLMLMVLML